MEHVTLANGRVVGEGHPPYVIAEIGSNHNGDMDLCRRLIDAAADAGADAVKFQSWSESSLIAREEYDAQPELLRQEEALRVAARDGARATSSRPSSTAKRRRYCRERGIDFCSSAFSPEEVDLLDGLDVPFLKIASMDVTNLPLLRYVAANGPPGDPLDRHGHARARSSGRSQTSARRGRTTGRPAALRLHLSARPRRPSTCATSRCCATPSTCRSASATTPWARRSRWPRSRSAPASSRSTSRSTRTWRAGITPSRPIRRSCATIVEGAAHGAGWRSAAAADRQRRRDREARRFRRSLVVPRDLAPRRRAAPRTTSTPSARRRASRRPSADYVVGRSAARDLGAEDELEWADLD